MSQRNPKLIDMEFAPARDRRPLAPLDDATIHHTVEGATSDIRSLMDQLQQTANEARHRLHAVEDERDNLSDQVHTLQDQTRDLRARVSEAGVLGQQIERLERERQELEAQLLLAREAGKGSTGTEQALHEASRQRDEARRRNEETARAIDALHRTVAELNERFAGGQAQLLGLRQARDGAQNQNRELAQKLAQQEDLIADLEYRLEKAAESRPAAVERPGEPDREELCRRIVELETRLDGAGELEQAEALAETAKLRAEIERLRQAGPGAAPEALEALRRERDAAQVQLQMATREVIELRAQMETRAGEIAGLRRAGEELVRERETLQARFQPADEEREAAVRARDETLTSLASAQKQIERIVKERDLLRDTGTQQTIMLEKQLEEAELSVEEARRENRELTARLEAQRIETIELGARLQSAQEQVRHLGASLAEARLLARAPARPGPPPGEAPPARPTPPAIATPPPAILPAPSPAAAAEPFPSAETHSVVRTMRRCYHAYSRDPDDLSHLNELHCAAHTFAEEARAGGCVAVYRLGLALAGLLQELYHFPEQITSEVLTSVVQSIEFLTALLKVRDLKHLRDPAQGTVCVIDDDAATRECIILSLETVMVKILAYQEPSEALCGLATHPCDLIFLDVQMPGMDGFELCTQVRQHSLHRHTPVIFVTGHTGADVRARAALCGGTDFLTKPFILAELALKAMVVMIRSELHLA